MKADAPSRDSLLFEVLGQRIRTECPDSGLLQLLIANFGSMAVPDDGAPVDLKYRIEPQLTGHAVSAVSVVDSEGRTLRAAGPGEALSLLEADITVALQKQRSDLFFLHAAAVEWNGRAFLFAAESGTGKSTTTWALLHHGFGYLSDELSPIDLESLRVFPYPHALCLKQAPPSPYELPESAIRLEHTVHVPTRAMPSAVVCRPLPIAAVVLLERREDPGEPIMQRLEPGEASARLYVAALNALAHPRCGLDAVVRIAENASCHALSLSAVPATIDLILSELSCPGPPAIVDSRA